MKKTFYLIYTFCAVFLSVLIFLNYSDGIYSAVFEDKTCVVIEKQEGQTNEHFVHDLALISKSVGAELLHATIEDASANKPTFLIYTTALSSAFIDVSTNYPDAEIAAGKYVTTEMSDSGTDYRIFGSSLYNHFRIYSWADAPALELEHSKFYTQTASVDILAAALTDGGYRVSMVMDDNRLEASAAMMELRLMFTLLTVFMFFSVICYAFSVRREIVIKKAHGYDEISVFHSTFSACLVNLPAILIGVYLLSGLLVEAAYPHTFLLYIRYGAQMLLTYLGVSVLLYLAACVYVQFLKSANEIRGNKPSRALYFLAVCLRVIVGAVMLWGLTCAQQAVDYENDLKQTQEHIGSAGNSHVVLSLNAGSVDFYGNTDEYTEKSNRLIKQLVDEYEAVLVDSSEYLDMSGSYERVLYVNEAYFALQPVYDADGMPIDTGSVSKDSLTILLPDNYSGEIIRFVQEQDLPCEILYYASGQRFHTFSQYSAIENHGFICDPIIALLHDSELSWRAQSILGMQFMLIPCSAADPYEELKSTIKQCGMSGVVLEAQRLTDIFDVAIMDADIKVFQYGIVSILYIAVLLLITVFEAAVYYENNKRVLTIKKLHGYGKKAYTEMFAWKIAVLAVLGIISLTLHYNIVFTALVAVSDIVVFGCCVKKLEHDSIVLYLKGDM